MKNLFVFSPIPLFPLKQGNRIRLYQTLEKFKEHDFQITFFCNNLEDGGVISEFHTAQHNQYFNRFIYTKYQGDHYKTVHRGEQSEIDVWDKTIEEQLKKELAGKKFTACLTNYSLFTKVFDFVPAGTHKIVEMHDRLGDRARLVNANGVISDFFSTTVEREIKYLDRADTVICIKDSEAKYLINNGFTKNAITGYSPLIDKDPFTLTAAYLFKNKSIGFIGSDNRVNRQCISSIFKSLLDNIVQVKAKDIKIKVAGRISAYAELIMPSELLEHVSVLGEIEDLAEFYKEISLLVNPTTFSTGFKLKNIESFSYGVPLISSLDASDGIPERPDYLLNDTPSKTVSCAISYLTDENKFKNLHKSALNLKTKYKKLEATSWQSIIERITTRSVCINIDQTFRPESYLLICKLISENIRKTDQIYFIDKFVDKKIFQYLEKNNYAVRKIKLEKLEDVGLFITISNTKNLKSRLQIGRSALTLTPEIKDKIYIHASINVLAENGSPLVRNWTRPYYFRQPNNYTSKKTIVFFKSSDEKKDALIVSALSKLTKNILTITEDIDIESISNILSNINNKFIVIDYSDISFCKAMKSCFYSFDQPILITNRIENANLFKRIQGPEVQFINVLNENDAIEIGRDILNSNRAYSKLMLWSPYRIFAGY